MFPAGKQTGNKVAPASIVCQKLLEFSGSHDAVFNYIYLQLVLIKPGPPCVDTLAVNITGQAGLNKALGGWGCWWIPQGALTLKSGGHNVTLG